MEKNKGPGIPLWPSGEAAQDAYFRDEAQELDSDPYDDEYE